MTLLIPWISLVAFSQVSSEKCYREVLEELAIPDRSGEQLQSVGKAPVLLKAIRLPTPSALSRSTDRAWHNRDRLTPAILKSLWFPPKETCPHPAVSEYVALKRLWNSPLPAPEKKKVHAFALRFVRRGVEIRSTLIQHMIYLSVLEIVGRDRGVNLKKIEAIKEYSKKERDKIHALSDSGYPASPEAFDALSAQAKATLIQSLRQELVLAEAIRTRTKSVLLEMKP